MFKNLIKLRSLVLTAALTLAFGISAVQAQTIQPVRPAPDDSDESGTGGRAAAKARNSTRSPSTAFRFSTRGPCTRTPTM